MKLDKRKNYFLVIDCETATLPFADEVAQFNAERKKRIAISKPLIYDIGWVIMDRLGNIVKKESYLIAETFCIPSIFNTAYYKEKRPIYLEELAKGNTTVKPWNDVMEIFIKDADSVNCGLCAYNAMFDFDKAITFTELYIKKLYSPNYQEWENLQRSICENYIVNGDNKNNPKKCIDMEKFNLRGKQYDKIDIWRVACESLINYDDYKKNCIKNEMLTNSGEFFKTSAESTYRYLRDYYDFEEAHTALEDAIIEAYILSQFTKRYRKDDINYGLMAFPFKLLGTTFDYIKENPEKELIDRVLEAVGDYVKDKESSYATRLKNCMMEFYTED